jgi:hypothetical protein
LPIAAAIITKKRIIATVALTAVAMPTINMGIAAVVLIAGAQAAGDHIFIPFGVIA